MEADGETFIAECYWPEVSTDDLWALTERIHACVADGVSFLGSLLIREDEVVLCQFEGRAVAVRRVAEAAGVPFERLLETTVAPPYPRDKRSPDA